METSKITLSFCAGVDTVTGANFLLTTKNNRKILVDCGLEQGSNIANEHNRDDFPYDPSALDILLVTHAHMDHIGRIPKLVKDGFKGMIYSTPATRDLAHVMLEDALRIIDTEARNDGVLPMYEKKDVEQALKLWKTSPYYSSIDLGDGLFAYIKDSGHILGAVMYEISRVGDSTSSDFEKRRRIIFTGDLGNSPSLFLRDTDPVEGATYMVMESVYGDRNHESKDERKQKLTEIIRDTIARKRTLVVPVFSLERTQDILYELNDLVESKAVGDIKVFMDSPLAAAVTAVYRQYEKDFKPSAKALVDKGDDLFDFKNLKFNLHHNESERLDHTAPPKIIMAGSGMSNGGRIVGHEKRLLPDPNTTMLLVGYQSVGTLGRQILEGNKTVEIEGEQIPVRADVKSIMGYSSHKDSDHLIEFVAEAESTLEKVFVTMGEPKSALFLVQRLRDYVGIDATAPKKGDSVEIEL